MRTGLAVLLALAAGCYRPAAATHCAVRCDELGGCPNQLQCGTDGLCFDPERGACSPDAAQVVDSAPIDGSLCFTTHFGVQSCYPAPTGALVLPQTIDTGTLVNNGDCQLLINGGAYCAFVANTIAVDSSVQVSGARPLVLFAKTGIAISAAGTLDVASHFGRTGGPGSSTTCSAAAIVGTTGNNGIGTSGSGGGGGSYQGSGGTGGNGVGNSAGGQPANEPIPTTLRGGCTGGIGGGDQTSANAGVAGLGGGAVYLITPGAIAIHGVVNASGAGGGAGGGAVGLTEAGAGGGGSGGMIVLEAASYVIDGVVLASGGGGGGGGGGGTGMTAPLDGSEPNPQAPTSPATGGTGSTTGNSGGAGSSRSPLAGSSGGAGTNTGTGLSGGGGGGGGAGWIFVANPPITDSFTPLATPL